MKLVTPARLIILTIVIAIVGAGLWLDRRVVPMHEGLVVIDEPFLQRLQTEDQVTTRDPAIKALLFRGYQYEILVDQLKRQAMTAEIRQLDRDSVEVTVRTAHRFRGETIEVFEYVHPRLTFRELISARWWKESRRHRPYWNQRSLRREGGGERLIL